MIEDEMRSLPFQRHPLVAVEIPIKLEKSILGGGGGGTHTVRFLRAELLGIAAQSGWGILMKRLRHLNNSISLDTALDRHFSVGNLEAF